MAATIIDMTRDGREGSASRAALDRLTEVQLTDTYWVVTTNGVTDGAADAMMAGGLPRMGDPHPSVPRARVMGLHPTQVPGRIDYWKVAVTYGTEFLEDADVDIDFEMHRVPVEGGTSVVRGGSSSSSANAGPNGAPPAPGAGVVNGVLKWGTPITNSAGEAYVPVPEDDEAYLVIRISRNESVISLDNFKKYTNSLNWQQFLGGDTRQWLMMVRGRPIPNNTAKLWRVEYIVKFKKATWDVQQLDHGRYYRANPGAAPGAMGALIPFKNDEKNNVLGNLDGKGGALAADKPPVFNRFHRRETVDWNPLGLDQTIANFYSKNNAPPPGDPPIPKVAK